MIERRGQLEKEKTNEIKTYPSLLLSLLRQKSMFLLLSLLSKLLLLLLLSMVVLLELILLNVLLTDRKQSILRSLFVGDWAQLEG